MMRISLVLICGLWVVSGPLGPGATSAAPSAEDPARWSEEQAWAWQRDRGWLVGANFSPSSAINQLEMWQADTFDPATIDRELGWAQSLGFNIVRVFLHDLPWQQDREAYLKRIDTFLSIAARHGIGVMLVLFDGVWDPNPRPGPQRSPKPHVHNSGWVQSPGAAVLRDPARVQALKPYVVGVLGRFRSDPRITIWDLFNEPDNDNQASYGSEELSDKASAAMRLLRLTFAWAREARPTQPLTAGVWKGEWATRSNLAEMDRFMLENSDVVSFHSYSPVAVVREQVRALEQYGRPLVCTEYMARPNDSTFASVLPFFAEKKIGAINWGFVSGKTQTIYPWDSWKKEYREEPKVWFHDIFRADGTPFDPREVSLIRGLTQKK